jgi:hypothetical protein
VDKVTAIDNPRYAKFRPHISASLSVRTPKFEHAILPRLFVPNTPRMCR